MFVSAHHLTYAYDGAHALALDDASAVCPSVTAASMASAR